MGKPGLSCTTGPPAEPRQVPHVTILVTGSRQVPHVTMALGRAYL